MMKKKILYGTLILVVLIITMIVLFSNKATSYPLIKNFDGKITFYKSATCGCCELYRGYFKSKGNKNLQMFNFQNLDNVKEKFEIPSSMESCHTTIFQMSNGEEYFVEGHVPLEAIEKLLSEQPDIKGIAIPGMPDGTPGMPGSKKGVWVVYQVNNDGTTSEFMGI